MRKKTEIQDMDRGIYDERNPFTYRKKTEQGLNESIVRQISAEKNEPAWMLEKRLEALKIFNEKENPSWGPDLSEVDMDKVITYIRPDADLAGDWNDVPEEIRSTFDKLGIPEAEKEAMLSGVGAQYDSEVVYHSIQQHLLDQGVVYTDFETGLHEYEDIVKEYFGKCINPSLHKYAALHYAVWSGGSFVYVPEGVDVDVPLQSYFRLNAPGAGQFEHTLIIIEKGAKCHFIEGCSAPKYNALNLHAGAVELFVKDDATLRYSTIENWSRNMYNLNTKRAIVGKNCHIGAGTVLAGVVEPASAVPVIIEDDVVIGANAVVLEGCRVGKGAVVAAGAVVVSDVEPNTVVAGIPAKVLKGKDGKTAEKTALVDALREL